MSASRSANIACALVILGWLMACYGVMSQFGDPAPTVPRSVIQSRHHVSTIILMVGMACLMGSLWLSGLSFAEARRRSLLVATLVVVPAGIVLAQLY